MVASGVRFPTHPLPPIRDGKKERENMQEIANGTRCGEAWQRGYNSGKEHDKWGVVVESLVLGEWDDSDIDDLLGDIIDMAVEDWEYEKEGGDGSAAYCHALVQYRGRITDELCAHYVQGYRSGLDDGEVKS